MPEFRFRFLFLRSARLTLLSLIVTVSSAAGSWPTAAQPEIWFKADSLSLTEGQSVFQWSDSSGHARHATHTPGVPTFRENVINGYPVLRFQDNLLKIPTFGDYKSLFIVYRMNRPEHWSEQAILWHPVSNSDSTFAGGFIYGRFQVISTGFPSTRRSNAYHPTSGEGFDLISSIAIPNVTLVYANRNILDNLSAATTGTSAASNLILGIRSDGVGAASHIATFGHFDLAELIVYKDALSTTERQQIEDYLHHKYWGPGGPDLSERVRAAKPGDIININNLNTNELPHLPVSINPAPDSPQLIFSDMPEYFRTGDGIAMQEVVQPGKIRLYTYHVPTPNTGNKIITPVIENLGSEPLSLQFEKYAFPNPSGHYLQVGKQGLQQFFTGASLPPTRTLQPGGIMPVDVAMDQRPVQDPHLVHGFYEFVIDQPARITLLQRPTTMSNAEAVTTLPKLPRILPGYHASGAGRGIFSNSNLDVINIAGTRVDTAAGNARLVIADGNRDPWVVGWDSIDEVQGDNKGNYGVVYHIRLKRTSSDGRALAAFMHNLYPSNNFCKHQSGAVLVSRGTHEAGLVNIPGNQVSFSEAGDNVLLQVFPPLEPGREETIEITYSPPGASCLPTPILFMPIDFPRTEAATFDGWRHRAGFSATELENISVTGWEADPRSLQIPNSLRYAFKMDPHQPDRSHLPLAEIRSYDLDGQNGNHLTLTYRRLTTQWDVAYNVETSNDLEKWLPAEVVPVSTVFKDDVQIVTVRESSPIAGESRRFIRVRVKREG